MSAIVYEVAEDPDQFHDDNRVFELRKYDFFFHWYRTMSDGHWRALTLVESKMEKLANLKAIVRLRDLGKIRAEIAKCRAEVEQVRNIFSVRSTTSLIRILKNETREP